MNEWLWGLRPAGGSKHGRRRKRKTVEEGERKKTPKKQCQKETTSVPQTKETHVVTICTRLCFFFLFLMLQKLYLAAHSSLGHDFVHVVLFPLTYLHWQTYCGCLFCQRLTSSWGAKRDHNGCSCKLSQCWLQPDLLKVSEPHPEAHRVWGDKSGLLLSGSRWKYWREKVLSFNMYSIFQDIGASIKKWQIKKMFRSYTTY